MRQTILENTVSEVQVQLGTAQESLLKTMFWGEREKKLSNLTFHIFCFEQGILDPSPYK